MVVKPNTNNLCAFTFTNILHYIHYNKHNTTIHTTILHSSCYMSYHELIFLWISISLFVCLTIFALFMSYAVSFISFQRANAFVTEISNPMLICMCFWIDIMNNSKCLCLCYTYSYICRHRNRRAQWIYFPWNRS